MSIEQENSVKHTPGPWLLKATPWPWGFYPATIHEIVTEEVRGRDGDEYEFHTSIVTVNNAAIGGGTASKFGEYPPAHEAEANARLIAAAPELLGALEAALAVHGDSYSWGAQARAAISKARGES